MAMSRRPFWKSLHSSPCSTSRSTTYSSLVGDRSTSSGTAWKSPERASISLTNDETQAARDMEARELQDDAPVFLADGPQSVGPHDIVHRDDTALGHLGKQRRDFRIDVFRPVVVIHEGEVHARIPLCPNKHQGVPMQHL
eukprot:GHVR01146247.1.p2 GENE.GHVR01146247.1~~GHVR01146247.1.p2  ORF type:complete len:140 (-),score=13.23 GHVR01146247.1:13-432(-)